jgi:eukaryotic-like serine/threonine-protein kinase
VAMNDPTLDPAVNGPTLNPPADGATLDPALGTSARSLPPVSIGPGHAPPPPQDAAFPRVEGYHITRLLGAGGMGEVYQAMQLGTRRVVALKLMRMTVASERGRLRFDREVELTARLDHPCIARIFDSGLHQGVYFYAMELIDGPPLDEFVRGEQLDRRKLMALFRSVCQAIAHAHQRGVIHRDLKPSNILVDKSGQPHVLDFGLAKALADTDPSAAALSIDGELAGTPAYMSPEQAAGRLDRLDTRTDVYTLGVILFKLLTDQFPHSVEGPYHEIARRISLEDIRRPRQVKRDLDSEIDALLLKAMAKDPDARYASAAELARDVDNYLNGDPLVAQPPTIVYFLRKRLWKYRVPLAIAATIVVMLAVVAIFSYVNIVHQRDLARIAEHNAHAAEIVALHQTEVARVERRNAELRRGEGLVAEGDVLGSSGRWTDAKSRYSEAHDLFVAEGASPLRADIGTWSAYRASPPPMNVIPDAAAGLIDLALSSDGRRAVGAFQDGKLRVWDLTLSRPLATIQASAGPIWSIALSADGQSCLVGSADGTATLWNPQTAHLIQKLGPLKGWVTHVALDPSLRVGLTVSGETAASLVQQRNDLLTIWDLATGKPLHQFQASGRVTRAAFSADGSLLATVGGEFALWDATSGSKRRSFPGGGQLTSVKFSPDGQRLITGGADTYARIWDAASGRQLAAFSAGSAPVNSVSPSPDGKLIFTVSDDATVKIWDTATDTELRSLSDAPGLRAAAFSADGRIAACAASDDSLTIWSLLPPPELREMSTGNVEVASIHFLPDEPAFLARASTRLTLWDLPTGRQLLVPDLPVSVMQSSALSPDGKTLAVRSDQNLVFLSTANWHATKTVAIDRSASPPAVLVFSPNGRLLLVPGAKYSLSLRRSSDGTEIRKFIGSTAPVLAAAFSFDSQKVLTGQRDGLVRLWDVGTGRLLRTFRGHQDAVHAVAFSPDATLAFSGGGNSAVEFGQNDFALRIWDVASGKCLHTLLGHAARIRALAVHPDGSIVVSASDDQTIKLWDPRTGQEIRTITGHTAPVIAVAFSPDGRSILSASQDHTLRLCDFFTPQRRKQLAADPGRYYAFLGLNNWAVDCLSQQAAAGKPISNLTLARCDWSLGDRNQAISQMRQAQLKSEAPADYLTQCISAIQQGR